ncbi:MAG: hypothetical protein CVU61_03685 [Deltaproteobacteria bacterium HGW-Deltaproteobacteria-19]|nr:MAG: hypothetical protein CVU61_03685 [Deltaproteobacteria bacterium HGW-Deltaproteobacteria-19]
MKGKGMKLRLCAVAIVLTAAAVLWGCAPITLYSIDMRYAPVKPISVGERPCGDRHVAVAVFRDARPAGDPLRIGTVIEPGGGRVPVLPEKVTAGEAVSSGIRSYLVRSGCVVAETAPAWNLKEDTIRPEWGDILLGGTIDALEVTCDRSDRFNPLNRYKARAKLTIVMADGKDRKIVHRTTVESTSSLEDIGFSREKLAAQVNGVLSDAIERIVDRSRKLYPGMR